MTIRPWALCVPFAVGACFADEHPVGEGAKTSEGTAGLDASTGAGLDSTSEEPASETAGEETTDGDPIDGSEETNGSTGGPSRPAFFDDFDRDDDIALGQGWTEKVATTWAIDGGRLTGEPDQGQFSFWQEHLWHRPPEDDAADVGLSVEFIITTPHPDNQPMLIARAQPAGLQDKGQFVGYSLYAEDSPNLADTSRITLQRTTGRTFEQWPSAIFRGALEPNEPYQLRLSVHGDLPVELHGALYRRVDETWILVGDVRHSDGVNERIHAAGSWGGGGGLTDEQTRNYAYDNFGADFGLTDAFMR